MSRTDPRSRSRSANLLRRAFAFGLAWVFAGAVYLVLIDTVSTPEVIVGTVAVTLAAVATELARSEDIAGENVRLGWLRRSPLTILKIPVDTAKVSATALRQLLHPRAEVGAFRAFPFRCADDERLESGRHALAEAFGSIAPNTIVVGVDREREMILGHQLVPTGGREQIDPMELG